MSSSRAVRAFAARMVLIAATSRATLLESREGRELVASAHGLWDGLEPEIDEELELERG